MFGKKQTQEVVKHTPEELASTLVAAINQFGEDWADSGIPGGLIYEQNIPRPIVAWLAQVVFNAIMRKDPVNSKIQRDDFVPAKFNAQAKVETRRKLTPQELIKRITNETPPFSATK